MRTAPKLGTDAVVLPSNTSQHPRPRMRAHNEPEVAYIRCPDKHKRAGIVLHYLDRAHRWSLNQFILHLVTAQPKEERSKSPECRAGLLAEAIQQEAVVKQLLGISDLRGIGNSALIKRLRTELRRIGSSDGGIEEFNVDTPVEDLNFSDMKERIRCCSRAM